MRYSYKKDGTLIAHSKWEQALLNNDQALAKELVFFITNKNITFHEVAEKIGYQNDPFEDGLMTSHFRRVLNELKILAVFGNHSWQHFHNVRNRIIKV
jgi:hypothetical protein